MSASATFSYIMTNIAAWMVIYASWRVLKHIQWREEQDGARRAHSCRSLEEDD